MQRGWEERSREKEWTRGSPQSSQVNRREVVRFQCPRANGKYCEIRSIPGADFSAFYSLPNLHLTLEEAPKS